MRGRGLKTLSAKRRIAGKASNAARTNNAAMLARKERSDGTTIVRLGAIASLPKRPLPTAKKGTRMGVFLVVERYIPAQSAGASRRDKNE